MADQTIYWHDGALYLEDGFKFLDCTWPEALARLQTATEPITLLKKEPPK